MRGFKPAETFRKGQVASYLLKRIEARLSGVNEEEFGDSLRLHVDHIQAKRSTAKWKDHEILIDRLGNLTLLGGTKNRSLSNKPFAEKKQAFRESRLKINAMLAKYEKWTPAEALSRQADFAKIAIAIWGSPKQSTNSIGVRKKVGTSIASSKRKRTKRATKKATTRKTAAN